MFPTPAGNPASMIRSPRRSAESGVCSAGFSTTVQPVASAGPSFQAAISRGKFHGMSCLTTPTGSRRVGEIFRPRCVGNREGDGVALNLGGPSRHVAKQVDGERNVGGLGDVE